MADELIVDLTQYKDKVGSQVPEGRYLVVVEDAELDKSKAGNAMINLWLRVETGDHTGAVIIDRLTQTPGALFRTVGFLQAIGIPTPKKRIKIPGGTAGLIGKRLMIDVEDGDPYNGRVKSEVRGFSRIAKSAEQPESMTGDDFEAAEATAEVPTEAAPDDARELAVNVPDEISLDELDL